MRAVVQRVSEASVTVEGREVARIGQGLLVLIGIGHDDGPEQADKLARKLLALRVFEDDAGKMNRSVTDIGGEIALRQPVHPPGRHAEGQPAQLRGRRPA